MYLNNEVIELNFITTSSNNYIDSGVSGPDQ